MRFWVKVGKIVGLVIGAIVGLIWYWDLLTWGLTHRLFRDQFNDLSAKGFLIVMVPVVLLWIHVMFLNADRLIATEEQDAAEEKARKCQSGN